MRLASYNISRILFFCSTLTRRSWHNRGALLSLPDRAPARWRKGQRVCFEVLWRKDNTLIAGCWKQPFCYKGTTPMRNPHSVPWPALGPVLQHFSCGQTDSALVAWRPLRGNTAVFDGLWSGRGRGALRPCSPCWLGSRRPGQPPQPSGSQPLSPSSSLCITHKTGSCIPMVLLLPVLQGTGTKHSTGTEKHHRQTNLS